MTDDDSAEEYVAGSAVTSSEEEEAEASASDYSGSPRKPRGKKRAKPRSKTTATQRKKGKSRDQSDHDGDNDNDNDDADVDDLRGLDDGNEEVYQARLKKWVEQRSEERKNVKLQEAASLAKEGDETGAGAEDTGENPVQRQDQEIVSRQNETEQEDQGGGDDDDDDTPEWLLPHPRIPDTVLDGGLRAPGDVYPNLFGYQKYGIQWLWNLYKHKVGGIVGDEMGLGKTVQIISFLSSLHHSDLLKGPVLIVCPPTLMKQWVNEFHTWWPPFRVSILHTSGSGMVNVKGESRQEDLLFSSSYYDDILGPRHPRSHAAAKAILQRVLNEGHVLVATYAGLQTFSSLLIPVEWACVVLDEGHKIRNPDTSITLHCKELRTPHRIILSGTPMQNNLAELWSLFDFVFPMRLGTLVTFREQFEFPIRIGGYANASTLQVQTAAKCAETLKDAINPYLLQRLKADVAVDLPKKLEQVLFCQLTQSQIRSYKGFLESKDVASIISGRREVLFGIDILRKICNHPDLPDHHALHDKRGYDYGNAQDSGKMQVVKSLLELWRDTGHKTLLFAQHRIMLDILEKFVRSMPNINYRRMDGNTPVNIRQTLVDDFNLDPSIHLFLLTTKVGGLGVNLTGADRVIIYDPDWNPSTDLQACERAWRLGQKRDVTIYRLMTSGTIEEKIYHRQIFKQFLTNKILWDAKLKQSFQTHDIHDLFTFEEGPAHTLEMFKEAETKFSNEEPEGGEDIEDTNAKESGKPVTVSDEVGKVTGINSIEDMNTEPPRSENEEQSTAQPDDGKAQASSTDKENVTESRLLNSIFKQNNIQAALEHSQIVKKVVRADPKIIEAEARRVATEAAQELLRAEEIARTIPIGTPTWTGTSGSGGRPDYGAPGGRGGRRMGGGGGRGGAPSSSALLANLTRDPTAVPPGDEPSGNSPRPPIASSSTGNASTPGSPSSSRPRGKEFMVAIRDYMLSRGGAVPSQALVDRFNRYCDTPRATAEFKEILKVLAVLQRDEPGAPSASRPGSPAMGGRGGRGMRNPGRGAGRARIQGVAPSSQGQGVWVLKQEFGGRAREVGAPAARRGRGSHRGGR